MTYLVSVLHAALNNVAKAKDRSYFFFRDQKTFASTDEGDNPQKIEELKTRIAASGLPHWKYLNVIELGERVLSFLTGTFL